MKKTFVSHDEMTECKTEVLQHDQHGEEKILDELKDLRKDFQRESGENARQHQDILKQVLRLHGGNHEG